VHQVNKMKKLLVICGPTATGKTSLAIHLAKMFDGELVSADSRQVYKGLDIGTGKDFPRNSRYRTPFLRGQKLGGYYEVDGTKIWAYDLVGPKREFSVARYLKVANAVIENIWSRGKLPILVGGTGLYIRAVVDGIPTVSVPKNTKLRESLEKKKVAELFEMLAQMDPIKAAQMNYSDKKNPRRLIRAVEIAQWKLKNKLKETPQKEFSTLFIGLRAGKTFLTRKIKKRVRARIRGGLEEEIRGLLKKGVKWENQSMASLGYKQWRGYFKRERGKKETIRDWEKEENKYSKKQITWFKRDKRINWFSVTTSSYQKKVEKLVKEWYKN